MESKIYELAVIVKNIFLYNLGLNSADSCSHV